MPYTITVTLDADDTPKTIAALAGLATCVSAAGTGAILSTSTGAAALIYKKLHTVCSFFTVRGETGNNVAAGGAGAANGAARVGFDANVSRGAAATTVHGEECLPTIRYDFPSIGAGQVYSMNNTYLCGNTGDVFQVELATL